MYIIIVLIGGENKMKKIVNVIMVLLMCFSLFACSNETGNKDDKVSDDKTSDVDTNNQNDASDSYETTELTVNDKVVKISYDPEELKLGSTGVSDTLKRFSGVNETFLIRLTPFKYDSVSVYGDDVVNGLISNGNYVNVRRTDISEDIFGTTKVKMFTVNYDSKIYQNMEKDKEYTQAELDQLSYELEAGEDVYYVIELEDGIMIDLLVPSGETKLKQMFEYIKFEI